MGVASAIRGWVAGLRLRYRLRQEQPEYRTDPDRMSATAPGRVTYVRPRRLTVNINDKVGAPDKC